jgi:hypothetical protein
MAGFGTAGSLLAGAGVLFILATAIVSFKGWPQVGGRQTPVAVSAAASHDPVYGSRAQTTRFAAVTAAQTTQIAAAAAAAKIAAAPRTHATSHEGTHAIATGPGTTAVAPGHPTSTGTTSSAGTRTDPPCSTCGRPSVAAVLSGTTKAATGGLGGTVSNAGSRLGSTVTGVTGTVAKGLGGNSAPVGKVVGGVGQALGGTVSGATGVLGGTTSGAGQVVGGLLGGSQ